MKLSASYIRVVVICAEGRDYFRKYFADVSRLDSYTYFNDTDDYGSMSDSRSGCHLPQTCTFFVIFLRHMVRTISKKPEWKNFKRSYPLSQTLAKKIEQINRSPVENVTWRREWRGPRFDVEVRGADTRIISSTESWFEVRSSIRFTLKLRGS